MIGGQEILLHDEVLDITKPWADIDCFYFSHMFQMWRTVGTHVYKTMRCCFTHLSFAYRSFVPQQDVMGVGYFAHKFLPKPLSIDG